MHALNATISQRARQLTLGKTAQNEAALPTKWAQLRWTTIKQTRPPTFASAKIIYNPRPPIHPLRALIRFGAGALTDNRPGSVPSSVRTYILHVVLMYIYCTSRKLARYNECLGAETLRKCEFSCREQRARAS